MARLRRRILLAVRDHGYLHPVERDGCDANMRVGLCRREAAVLWVVGRDGTIDRSQQKEKKLGGGAFSPAAVVKVGKGAIQPCCGN